MRAQIYFITGEPKRFSFKMRLTAMIHNEWSSAGFVSHVQIVSAGLNLRPNQLDKNIFFSFSAGSDLHMHIDSAGLNLRHNQLGVKMIQDINDIIIS